MNKERKCQLSDYGEAVSMIHPSQSLFTTTNSL